MDKNLRQAVLACPEVLRYLDLHGIELAAIGFDIMLAAVSRDDHGHFYKDGGAPCPHKKRGKAKPEEKALKLPEGFKAVEIPDVYRRIGGTHSEIVKGSDGKPSKFSQLGINHFKNKGFEKIKRLKSLDVAQDTVRAGKHFESKIPNTDITQTEFIKDYGKKLFYTARRNDTGEVYSWHELERWQYKKKERFVK